VASRWLAIAAVLAAAVGCKSMSGPPSSFGVNVTVDASALSSADRAKVVTGLLRVTGDESAAKRFDVASAIGSGQLRFRFIPSITSGTLTLAFDALDASDAVVATGAASSAVVLMANAAVAVTLKLGPGSGKKVDSTACTTGADCNSGFCVDGVCCNEKCDDVCASCALAGSKGVCTPYAADTDPENECGPKIPMSSGGTGDGGPADGAAASDGSADGGGAGDGSATSSMDGGGGGGTDALVLNPPDGGIMNMPAGCGGKCGGTRACKFPGAEKSCGTPFCNTSEQVASFVCDGNGGCTVGFTTCTDYACDPAKASCRTQCAQTTDCADSDFCNANGVCQPKKGISIPCTLGTECQSGFCASGVCCNTACDQTGMSCSDSGSVGKCKCAGLSCTMGCALYYPDTDGDGFGDKFAVYTNPPVTGSARVGCVEGPAPAPGYVADNTDCDDGDANAKPGQTAFFNVASAVKHTFDYDCDGVQEKQTAEYPGGYCRFCGSVGSCDTGSTSTCAAANNQSSFQCPQELALFGAAAPAATITPPGIICQVCLLQCCGCHTADQNGFTATVNCGAVGTITHCGTCAAAGGGPANTFTSDYQRCH
jgi:hypothetical protein